MLGLTGLNRKRAQSRRATGWPGATPQDGLNAQRHGHGDTGQQQALPGGLHALAVPTQDHGGDACREPEQERESLVELHPTTVGGDVASKKERRSGCQLEPEIGANRERDGGNAQEKSSDQTERDLSRVPEVGHPE